MSGARFCVVNIEDEEDSLEVVPTKWLIPSTDACWWPKSGADSNFVKSEVEPCHETWVQVYVEIIQYFQSYESAKRSIDRVEEDIATPERKRHKPQKRDTTIKRSPSSIAEDADREKFTTSSNVEQNSGDIITDIFLNPQLLENVVRSATKTILDELSVFKAKVEQSFSNLHSRLDRIESKIGIDPSLSMDLEESLKLPMETIDDLENMEILMNEEGTRQALLRKLSFHRSNRMEYFIRKCLQATFTDRLATVCSWSGVRESTKISDTQLIAFIQRKSFRPRNLT
uniref:DUF4806 domain-containing protein n=1 Tax=Photinus pyralis TaxID=7054 RepID=A0A1Y1NIG2_PHOPY